MLGNTNESTDNATLITEADDNAKEAREESVDELRERIALARLGDYSRRARLEYLSTAERAIRAAVIAVEGLPADVRLTDAVVLLQAARESVADFVDGINQRRFLAGQSDADNLSWGGAIDAAAHTAVDTTDDVASGSDQSGFVGARGAGESPAQAGSPVPTPGYDWSRAVTALENWGRHFDWCAIKRATELAFIQCDCGLAREVSELRTSGKARLIDKGLIHELEAAATEKQESRLHASADLLARAAGHLRWLAKG